MTRTSSRWASLGLAGLVLLLIAGSPADTYPRPIPPVRGEWVVEITAIQPNGPAFRAGLEVRDQILEIDGVKVSSLPHLRRLLIAADYSARLTVLNWRTGKEVAVYVYPDAGRIGIDARMVLALPPRRYPY
jgi:S1-C subfamily serine protease